MLEKFTSRKFLLAVVTFGVAILSAQGVIPASAEAKDVAFTAPLVYILVEGVIDFIAAKRAPVLEGRG